MLKKSANNQNLVAAVLTAVWMIISLFVISRHEIWLDEAQHWLLARDSNSLADLYKNMKYEGHPPLWNLLLFLLSRISDSPAIMQYVHLAFAGGTVFLLTRYAPFPLWAKILLPFTFFLGYEYAVIARNYAPAVFFIVLAMVWSQDLQRNLLRISLALSMALLFHLYAGGIAIVLLIYFFLKLKKNNETRSVAWVPLAVLFVSGIIALWFLFLVPRDHFITEYHAELLEFRRIGTILLLPFTALVHFPVVTGDHWWNTNIFLVGPDLAKGIIGLVFWFVPALVFRRNRAVLVVYITGTLLLSGIMLLTPMAVTVRHAGFVAVLFLICAWMAGESVYETRLSKIILTSVLVVQACSYFTTVYKECSQPFSNSKNVADYVRTQYPQSDIAAYPMFVRSPVSAYLNKQVFYPGANGNFASWKRSAIELKADDFLQECRNYMNSLNLDSMVVIGHTGYKTFELNPDGLELRATFRGAAVGSEDYVVYILKQK